MGNNFHKLVNVSPNPALKTVGTGLTGAIAPQPLRYVG